MKPERVLAFDPGKDHVGWAFFDKFGLMHCGFTDFSKGQDLQHLLGLAPMHVIVEVPQIYPGRSSKGDPNDLISVAVTVGRIVQLFGSQVETVRPRTWKGTVDPDVMLDRIISRLMSSELVAYRATKVISSRLHNVIDAVGIGLYKLGRL